MRRRTILIALLAVSLGLLACALSGQAPTPTPTSAPAGPTPTAGWPTYTSETHGFSISHPPEFSTPPTDSAETFGAIGDQIFFSVNTANPVDCLGDCPVIETNETVSIAGQSATRLTGFMGAVGGGVPQQYQTYVFTKDALYYSFTLYAVPSTFTTDDTSIQPLQPEDIALFEQMLATFQFTS